MSNLIRYIIQDDPEKEIKKKNLNYTRYPFLSRKNSEISCRNPSALSNDAEQISAFYSKKQNVNQNNNIRSNNIPRYWETAKEGKEVYDYVLQQEGNSNLKKQDMFDYIESFAKGAKSLGKNFSPMRKMKVTDKYKHAFMNCKAAQFGEGGNDIAKTASDLREWRDVTFGKNTLDSSNGDNYANKIGRILGRKYPKGDCDEIVQRYIKKNL